MQLIREAKAARPKVGASEALREETPEETASNSHFFNQNWILFSVHGPLDAE